jgi:DNA repair photolyase
MSSVTDPYVPQEKSQGVTRSVLLEMLERPPDVLVIQNHATLVERDIDILWQIRDLTQSVLEPERVLISCEGFNAV